MISKKIFSCHLLVALISVALSLVFLSVGRSLVSNLFGISENFYLKYYYDLFNGENAEKKSYNVPDSLVIVNLQYYRSRLDIARIIELVHSNNPSCIGLDVFFPNNPDINEEVNNRLVSAINKAQAKLVVPCNYSTDGSRTVYTELPFFFNLPGLDSLTYASPLANDFFDYYEFDDSSIPYKDSLTLIRPRMGIELVKHSNSKLRRYDKEYYINYTKKDLSQIIINDTSEIRTSTIRDKIVLIGDMSEIKDMTRLPFRFGKKKEISGVEDLAYSIISIRQNTPDSIDGKMRCIGFQELPMTISLFLAMVLSFLFCFIRGKLSDYKIECHKNGKLREIVVVLLNPIIIILAEIAVILICFTFTYWTHFIPDLFVSMVAIALVSISMELTESILR